jgi:hypothetical protein
MTVKNRVLAGGVAFDGFHHRRGVETERGKIDVLTGFVDFGPEGRTPSQPLPTQLTLAPTPSQQPRNPEQRFVFLDDC